MDCLDRNAEEMKNLVGKFAGFIVVAAVMIIMGVSWGTSVCWKLALVGIGCGPVLYALTRLFESVNQKWENRSRQTQEVVAGIFTETFLDIRTVRALTLESYFDRKHYKSNWQSLTIGLKRACCTAGLYGLSNAAIVFVYGECYADSQQNE
jgi:ATP-binding cassette subfamily B (MDR/TAP) protein 1